MKCSAIQEEKEKEEIPRQLLLGLELTLKK